MKSLGILLIVFTLTSCSKSSNNVAPIQNTDPTVTTVKFFPVYAGSNESVAFKITTNIPKPETVARMNLYLYPEHLRDKVDNPISTTYTMYDHIGDYPHGTTNVFYQIEFVMKDGRKILLDKFMVN